MASLKRLRRRTTATSVTPAPSAPSDPEASPSTPSGRSPGGGLTTLRRTSATAGSSAAKASKVAALTAGRTGRTVARRAGLGQAWLYVLAAHPLQALLTAVGVAAAAALIERPAREIAVVFLTVVVGQTILGWHNDIVDRHRDARHLEAGRASQKPIADGRLEVGNVWFALICAVLLVVPLSVSTGVTAGSCYLLSVAVGLVGHLVLRRGIYSWIPWAIAYALLPAYVAFGGWGGNAEGESPQVLMTLLAAALGVGVHTMRALFGLVADHEDGWTYWPLRLSLRLGATKMLLATMAYLAVLVVAILITGATVGLRQ
ncbi:hypothetical protein GCM10027020_37110 [Nocardioides salsibiostraticola]